MTPTLPPSETPRPSPEQQLEGIFRAMVRSTLVRRLRPTTEIPWRRCVWRAAALLVACLDIAAATGCSTGCSTHHKTARQAPSTTTSAGLPLGVPNGMASRPALTFTQFQRRRGEDE